MITVVGSLNMDLVIHTERVPKIGETLIGGNFVVSPGGKGANQALAAAKLRGKVSMIGCVGNDDFGKSIVKNLENSRVDTLHVSTVKGISTGVASITVNGDGDNFIIIDPGANFKLTPEKVETCADVIVYSKVLLVQLETPIESVAKALKIAKDSNVMTILNPAPARIIDDSVYKTIDLITPNETECEVLTGIKVETIEDAKRAVEYFLSKGVKGVVITAGSRGSYYTSGSQVYFKESHKVEAVDTTAAGDAFSGAIAVALSNGLEIGNAIDFCSIVGALTVTKSGAQSSLPSYEEVLKFAKERNIKINV